jgi:hypothetical protein
LMYAFYRCFLHKLLIKHNDKKKPAFILIPFLLSLTISF